VAANIAAGTWNPLSSLLGVSDALSAAQDAKGAAAAIKRRAGLEDVHPHNAQWIKVRALQWSTT
jgi:hypothetical protein